MITNAKVRALSRQNLSISYILSPLAFWAFGFKQMLKQVFVVCLRCAGGIRTGGYPKSSPIPGPLGHTRPGDWDFLWTPARLALKAVPSLRPGQLVSACPGLMSVTKKVSQGACQAYAIRHTVTSFCTMLHFHSCGWLHAPCACCLDVLCMQYTKTHACNCTGYTLCAQLAQKQDTSENMISARFTVISASSFCILHSQRRLPVTLHTALGEELAWSVMPRSFMLPDELPQLRALADKARAAAAGAGATNANANAGDEGPGSRINSHACASSSGASARQCGANLSELWILKTPQHLGKGLKLVTLEQASLTYLLSGCSCCSNSSPHPCAGCGDAKRGPGMLPASCFDGEAAMPGCVMPHTRDM